MKAFLLGICMLLLVAAPAFAQETLQIETITVTPTTAPNVTYDLPYPGVLPDNPLYGLKAVRDRIISFLISDPLKKSEFDLLQADKRVQAGLFLLHREKPDVGLAISTISKGQNYFEEAIIAAIDMKKHEDDKATSSDLPDRLTNAAMKYNQLLGKEASRIPAASQKEFQAILRRSQKLIKLTEPLHTAKSSNV
jgi:hypothetical protein